MINAKTTEKADESLFCDSFQNRTEDCSSNILPWKEPDKDSPKTIVKKEQPSPEKSVGLKGSTQHWLAVYPPEFEIPTFFAAVDSRYLGLIAHTPPGGRTATNSLYSHRS